jgi:hypothetical protein
MLEVSVNVYDTRQYAKDDSPLKEQRKLPCEACKSDDTKMIYLYDFSKKEEFGDMAGWDKSVYEAEYKCNQCGKYTVHKISGWTKES